MFAWEEVGPRDSAAAAMAITFRLRFRRQAYRFQLLIETRSVCSFAFHDSTLEGLVCVSVALFCGQRHPQPQDLHLLGSKMHQRSTTEHIRKNQIRLPIRLPKLRCACRYFVVLDLAGPLLSCCFLLFLLLLQGHLKLSFPGALPLALAGVGG